MFEIHDSVQHLQGATATRWLIVDRALQYLDSRNAEAGADTSLQRELATAYAKVGGIQAQDFYAKARDLFIELRARGALMPTDRRTSTTTPLK